MRVIGSTGLAALACAAAVLAWGPARAIDIDPDNLPPWPARHQTYTDMPSRYDTAPVAGLVAAADTGESEAKIVLRRRQTAKDEAVLAWARAEAAANNPRAMVMLAQMLATSDPAESLRLNRAAADLGHLPALNSLAYAYAEGRGVEKDTAEAMRLWTQAAEQGDGSAIVNLMNIYRNGVIVPRDPAMVAKWDAVAREKGVQIITTDYPPGFPPERPRVDKAPLLTAAQAGDAVAMVELASAYDRDYDDNAAPAQAFRWYKAAADAGEPRGMFGLGQAYRYGKGVGQDKARGVDWLLRAARAGNVTAMHNLERIYRTGEGVKADPEQANHWRDQAFWSPDAR